MLEDDEVLTDKEIVKMMTQEPGNNSEESNNEADGTTKQSITHADTTATFDLALCYVEQHDVRYSRRHHVFKMLTQCHINLQVSITSPEKIPDFFIK